MCKIDQKIKVVPPASQSKFELQRFCSQPVDRSSGVLSDEIIRLKVFYSRQGYPDKSRRVHYLDAHSNRRLRLLTNNFTLSRRDIADLDRCRGQVDLFFMDKQHLRVKAFYGATDNAVKTQASIAVSVYVLVAKATQPRSNPLQHSSS